MKYNKCCWLNAFRCVSAEFFLLYDRQSSLNMITERYLKAQNFNTKLNYVWVFKLKILSCIVDGKHKQVFTFTAYF